MAFSYNNIATSGLSGRVGDLIFRQRYGKTVVYCLPCPYPSSTLVQKACQAKFTDAVHFAQMAKKDPVMIEFFMGIKKKNQSIYHAAISYYMLYGFKREGQSEKEKKETPTSYRPHNQGISLAAQAEEQRTGEGLCEERTGKGHCEEQKTHRSPNRSATKQSRTIPESPLHQAAY